MSNKKKLVREKFKKATFTRDNYACVTCRVYFQRVRAAVDAHHITDRNKMPNGGYVVENGISLCEECHELAEAKFLHDKTYPGWEPPTLYALVKSNWHAAIAQSLKL